MIKHPGVVKGSDDAAKIPISIRLDGSVLAALKTEAVRLGIPYQTFISSVLHRYINEELLDRNSSELAKLLKAV